MYEWIPCNAHGMEKSASLIPVPEAHYLIDMLCKAACFHYRGFGIG